MDEREDTTIYKVVVNHEEQYSIWPLEKENPLGWRDAGKSGPKAECLAYIKDVVLANCAEGNGDLYA